MAREPWVWRRSSIILLGLVIVGCSTGISVEEHEAAVAAAAEDKADLENQIEGLDAEIARLGGELDAALADLEREQAGNDVLRTNIDAAEAAKLEAEQAAAAAAEREAAVLLAFDPQIKAAREAFAASITSSLCEQQRQSPDAQIDVEQAIADFIAANPEAAAALVGYEPSDLVDIDAVAALVTACYEEALLTAPHGDGFHTVGDEIAAGRWRSTGSGSDCYWARLDANQNILDNHFGDAGGTVTIRSSDYEVEFDDCGEWEYLG